MRRVLCICLIFITLLLACVPATAAEDPQQETVAEETTFETAPEEVTLPPEEPEETLTDEIFDEEPEEAEPLTVPLFFQTDYPDVLYSHGTLATSGCGITSLAMVATALTGHPYLPDELAGWFGGYMKEVYSNVDRLEAASDVLQLPWYRAANCHEALQAVADGKIAIFMMNSQSLFTSSEHFIVLTGMDEDGKYWVNDPYEPNYDKWQLKNGFENGFDGGVFYKGFSGAWIYDPAEMPEEPFIYYEEKIEVECRYPQVILSTDEQILLAKMVWVEARGECAEGQQAVAEVVLNRLVAGTYGSTVREIIYSEGQFRSTPWLDEATPTQTQFEAVDAALNGPYVLPMEVTYFGVKPPTDQVWGTIGGHTFCYPASK